MKKLLCLILSIILLLGAFSVSATAEDTPPAGTTEPEDPPSGSEDPPAEPEDPPLTAEEHTGIVSLEGKTVMIVGNSMVYYGNCVIKGDQGKADEGYFYQLAAANDENVTVIDHTYSGKKLDYIYDNYLKKLSREERDKVDYIVLSEGNQVNEDLVGTCEKILALFREDVEFRFLRQPMMFETDMPCLIEGVEALRQKGYTVVDWGKLVYDVYSGATEVPGATLPFNRCSFMKENLGYKNGEGTVLNTGNKGDRNHENPLSGYVTAQMLYTSITNRSAVYTDYTFCNNPSIHPYFDLEQFARVHYTGPDKTNMHEIFRSPQDMTGLQQLMDAYLRREGLHPLVVRPAVKPTCTRGGFTQGSYCALCDVTVEEQQYVPADTVTEHTPVYVKGQAATCTENGKSVGIYCEECGHTLLKQTVLPYYGHQSEDKLIPATTKADGSQQQICKACRQVLESTPIPRIASAVLSEKDYIYDGLEKVPTVTVTDSTGELLVENRDYTLTYSTGRIEVKNYKITVNYTGNYKGKTELVYEIRPAGVQNLKATPYVKTVKLTWDAVAGATHYRIYRYDAATRSYGILADVTGTSYKDVDRYSATSYKYKVRPLVIAGDRTYYSPQNKYVTTVTKPLCTTLKKAASSKAGTATLTWKKVSRAEGYVVTYATSKSFKKAKTVTVKNGAALKTTLSGLTKGKVYNFKVCAYRTLNGENLYGKYSSVKRTRIKKR